MSYVGLKIRNY